MTLFVTKEGAMRKGLRVVQDKRHPCRTVTVRRHAAKNHANVFSRGPRAAYSNAKFLTGFTVEMYTRRGYSLGMM